MAKSLDFRKVKKNYFTITLDDGKDTVLMIGTPTKAIMDRLIDMEANLKELQAEASNAEAVTELYAACAAIMSRNKGGVKVTADYLSEVFDIEDIILFFSEYMNFIGEISKN